MNLKNIYIYKQQMYYAKTIKQHKIFITYLLGPRETVCFVDPRRRSRGHKTHCFPEVSVNKCFVI